ncbi:MAG: beta-ketoacyl-[acyl-carrier-protein] synthase II [Candidatus Wallbacteria bacterium]|nr:beta-ketoacyl-[acyl-carrier-protein] synthase II [Candidatus Wallbacteria bacterium]
MGVVTPVGIGVPEFWKSLLEGQSGVDFIKSFDASSFPTRFAAEVKGFDGRNYVDKPKALKLMGKNIQFALAAAKMAVEDSGLALDKEDPTALGVIMGAGIVNSNLFELSSAIAGSMDANGRFDLHKFATEGKDHLFPLSLLKHLPNMVAGHISIAYNCQGLSNTITTACASATQAIGEAYRTLARGECEIILSGGADSRIEPLGLTGYSLLGALSKRNDDPRGASRPFDKDRDGFIIGEGAGVVVLENLEHARKRGARILGEVLGYGAAADGYRVTDLHPDGRGSVRSIKLALADAGLTPQDVDLISAHGTSTVQNDRVETVALKQVFGADAYRIPVSATTSMLGHLGAASGAVQFVATVQALRENVIPPTINYQTPDPECDLDYVPNECRRADISVGLSNSFGFGGQNAAILVREWSGDAPNGGQH